MARAAMTFARWHRARLGGLPVGLRVGLWLLYGFLWIPLWYLTSKTNDEPLRRRAAIGILVAIFGVGAAIGGVQEQRQKNTTSAKSELMANSAPTTTGDLEPTSTRRESPSPPKVRVELGAAVARGLVEFDAYGAGLEDLVFIVRSRGPEAVTVDVEAGTRFLPRKSNVQSMVVRRTMTLHVYPGVVATERLPVACADMRLKTPSADDTFPTVDRGSDKIRALMATSSFAASPFRVQQFAVWIVSENPTIKSIPAIGMAYLGEGPSKTELDEIRRILIDARMDPNWFVALR